MEHAILGAPNPWNTRPVDAAMTLDVAASAKVVAKQSIVVIGFGALSIAQLAPVAGFFDEIRNASGIETVEFATDRLARLAHRERLRTRISARSTTATG